MAFLFSHFTDAEILIYSLTVFTSFYTLCMLFIRKRFTVYPRIPYWYFLLIFVFVGFLVNIFDKNQDIRWRSICIAFPLIFILVNLHVTSIKKSETITFFIFLIGFILCTLMIFTDAKGHFPSLNGMFSNRYRAYLFNEPKGPVYVAEISALCSQISFIYILFKPKRGLIVIGLVSLPILMFYLIISGGRMAWISTLFMFLFSLWLYNHHPQSKKKVDLQVIFFLIITTFVVIFVISTLNLDTSKKIELLDRFKSVISGKVIFDFKNLAGLRYQLWDTAIGLAINNPFGSGFGTFAIKSKVFANVALRSYSTHNEFLSILNGTGFIGFIFLGLFLFSNFRMISKYFINAKDISEITYRSVSLVITIWSFINSITSAWSFSNTITTIMIWTIFSIGVVRPGLHKEEVTPMGKPYNQRPCETS